MTPKTSISLDSFLEGVAKTPEHDLPWDVFARFLNEHGVKKWSLIFLPVFKNLVPLQGSSTCGWETLNEKGFVNLHSSLSSEDVIALKKSLKHVIANEPLQALLDKDILSPTDADAIQRIFGADNTKTIMVCPAYGPHSNNVCLFYVHDDKGQTGLSLSISTAFQALHNINSKIREETKPRQRHLSPREVQILEAIAQGKTNEEVAQALQISRYTINGYLKTIFLKMNCSDRTTAVLSGLALGIIG